MNSGKKWEVLSESRIEHPHKGTTFAEGSHEVRTEDIIKILLENRGLKSKKEIDDFLNPKLEEVTINSVKIDPQELKKALQRIQQAIKKKEKVIVYGDYDVDGITGTAILWESLHAVGANVTPYIPHRIDEGYGLSVKGITNILEEYPDVSLIITVDNGIVANDAVAFANAGNIDVIITDHHTIGESLPSAFAIVHTTAICGAAVGWMVGQEILNKFVIANEMKQSSFKEGKEIATSQTKFVPRNDRRNDHLSLVALATVADLVPLTGANRTLLKFGLEVLKKTTRPGLLALFKEAKIDPEHVGVYTIGHGIAPRLNAMGRLESAMDSLRLLCTTNKYRAGELAQKLELTNRERQLLTSSTVEHAKQQVIALSKRTKILFIHHETYEEGVIGLVAGKLVETFYLPAIVLSKGEKYSKASARSIAGFNIIEAIRKSSELLVNAGGHPMAAGFTVETEKIELLKEALEQVADGAIDETMLKRILRIDMEIPLKMVSQKLFDAIHKLAPFGMACPEPVFMSDVVVKEVRQIGMDGKHLKLQVSPVILGNKVTPESKKGMDSGQARMTSSLPIIFDAIAFGMGGYIADLKKGDTIQLVYTIDENTWNGKTNLQLKVKDIQGKI